MSAPPGPPRGPPPRGPPPRGPPPGAQAAQGPPARGPPPRGPPPRGPQPTGAPAAGAPQSPPPRGPPPRGPPPRGPPPGMAPGSGTPQSVPARGPPPRGPPPRGPPPTGAPAPGSPQGPPARGPPPRGPPPRGPPPRGSPPGMAPGMTPARGPPPTGPPPRGAPGVSPGMQARGMPPGSPRGPPPGAPGAPGSPPGSPPRGPPPRGAPPRGPPPRGPPPRGPPPGMAPGMAPARGPPPGAPPRGTPGMSPGSPRGPPRGMAPPGAGAMVISGPGGAGRGPPPRGPPSGPPRGMPPRGPPPRGPPPRSPPPGRGPPGPPPGSRMSSQPPRPAAAPKFGHLIVKCVKGIELKHALKQDDEHELFKVAARNLREYNGVPSMSPLKLTKTLTFLKLHPRRLVEQGLAPKALLTQMNNENKDAAQPLGDDNNDDLVETVASAVEAMHVEDDDKEEWNDGYLPVATATPVPTSSATAAAIAVSATTSSTSESGSKVVNSASSDAEETSPASVDEKDEDDADPTVSGRGVVHKAFIAGGIKLPPREIWPVLIALDVGPRRLVELGHIDAEHLRAMAITHRRALKKQRHMCRGVSSGASPGPWGHGAWTPSCDSGDLLLRRGRGGHWGRRGPGAPGARGTMGKVHVNRKPGGPTMFWRSLLRAVFLPPRSLQSHRGGPFGAHSDPLPQSQAHGFGNKRRGPCFRNDFDQRAYPRSFGVGRGGPGSHHGPPRRAISVRNPVGPQQCHQHGYHYWG